VLPVIKRNCRTARNQLIRPGIYGDRLARSCRSMLIPTFGCSTVGSILIYGVEYFSIALVGSLVSVATTKSAEIECVIIGDY